MKKMLSAAAALAALAVPALAQTDHQQHHPGGSGAAQTQAPPAPPAAAPPQGQMPMGQMMQNMPEQCRVMMQNMPQGCMGMMQQMMQGNAGRQDAQGATDNVPASTKAYLEAANKVHGPMMEGAKASDPDVAFVKGMIPHHQGAIDMARVVLQHAKDEQVKKWANDVIAAQEREIAEMQAWLKAKGKL